jgi:hypothetical protein
MARTAAIRFDVGGNAMKGSVTMVEVFSRVFRIYMSQSRFFLSAATCAVLSLAGASALPSVISGSLGVVALIIDVGTIILFTGLVIERVADVYAGGHGLSTRATIRRSKRYLGKLAVSMIAAGSVTSFFFLLGSTIASGLLISVALGIHLDVIGAIPLLIVAMAVFFLPGLLLMTIWSVVAPVAVLERPTGLGALARSRKLVDSSRWQVVAVIVALLVLLGIIAALIYVLADRVGMGLGVAAGVVASIVVAPLSPLVSAVLYFELARPQDAPVPGGSSTAVGHGGCA